MSDSTADYQGMFGAFCTKTLSIHAFSNWIFFSRTDEKEYRICVRKTGALPKGYLGSCGWGWVYAAEARTELASHVPSVIQLLDQAGKEKVEQGAKPNRRGTVGGMSYWIAAKGEVESVTENRARARQTASSLVCWFSFFSGRLLGRGWTREVWL